MWKSDNVKEREDVEITLFLVLNDLEVHTFQVATSNYSAKK